MKHILLTISLILGATAVSAEEAPTPYELLTEGTVIDRLNFENTFLHIFVAWDKTKDIYRCEMSFADDEITCQILLAKTDNVPNF